MQQRKAQQAFQPTPKAAHFSAHMGCVGLGAAEAAVALLVECEIAYAKISPCYAFRR
jgi:hypothetical protein